jgi:hypothetical protein
MVPELWTDLGGIIVAVGLLAWQHRRYPQEFVPAARRA